MNVTILRRVGATVALVLACAIPGGAQTAPPTKLHGVIADNADALGAIWLITGEWSLAIRGDSGKATFVASITMRQNAAVPGAPHTHHIFVKEAAVEVLANGYAITGVASTSGNGAFAGDYATSPITIEVLGGADLPVSNLRVMLHSAEATRHFGTDPLNGVVVYEP